MLFIAMNAESKTTDWTVMHLHLQRGHAWRMIEWCLEFSRPRQGHACRRSPNIAKVEAPKWRGHLFNMHHWRTSRHLREQRTQRCHFCIHGDECKCVDVTAQGKTQRARACAVLYWLRKTAAAQWPERAGSAGSAHSNPGGLQSSSHDSRTQQGALKDGGGRRGPSRRWPRRWPPPTQRLLIQPLPVWAPKAEGGRGLEHPGWNRAIGQGNTSQARRPSRWRRNRVETDRWER